MSEKNIVSGLKISPPRSLFEKTKFTSHTATPATTPRSESGSFDDDSSSMLYNSSLGFITNRLHVFSHSPTCIVMCGLPARGKSYIVTMLKGYLTWQGFDCKIFNVGNYRRKMSGLSQDASFFNFSNPQANLQRNKAAEAAFRDVKEFLLGYHESDKNLRIAIFDATNTTRERRRYLMECVKDTNIEMIFIESICNDKQILETNYNMKLKSPDYIGMDPKEAREDFEKRVAEYEKIYETLDQKYEGDLSYIKLFDVGLHMELNKMHGYCAMEIVTYLGNIHIKTRRIFLLRHGESENDVKQILSGDCKLTHRGKIFASQVRDYLKETTDPTKPLLVFSSTLAAATYTMERLKVLSNAKLIETHVLDELGGGLCQGMTYDEIKKKYKEEFEEREKKKLIYRYPGAGGESYLDLIERLKPMILEIERTSRDVVIISHNAVLRVILGYFLSTPIKDIPYIDFPKESIIQLTINPYGCDKHLVNIDMKREAELLSSASNTPTPKSANSPDKT